jgi:hypothetical protein
MVARPYVDWPFYMYSLPEEIEAMLVIKCV